MVHMFLPCHELCCSLPLAFYSPCTHWTGSPLAWPYPATSPRQNKPFPVQVQHQTLSLLLSKFCLWGLEDLLCRMGLGATLAVALRQGWWTHTQDRHMDFPVAADSSISGVDKAFWSHFWHFRLWTRVIFALLFHFGNFVCSAFVFRRYLKLLLPCKAHSIELGITAAEDS